MKKVIELIRVSTHRQAKDDSASMSLINAKERIGKTLLSDWRGISIGNSRTI